jgi:ankyrin repeat protein
MTVAVSQVPTVSEFPLHNAAAVGNVDAFNDLVKEVADLNVLNELHQTPLHVAAIHGETTVGAYITECGGDVAIKDLNGNTPLHLAAMNNKRLFVSMLLWGEADMLDTNNDGNTAMHEAAKRGFYPVIFVMMQNGGEDVLKIKNKDGKTPTDLARESGNEETIECLSNPDAHV